MEEFFEKIPEWIKWLVAFFGGGGAGGFGIHRIWKMRLKADQQDFDQEMDRRNQLRKDVDNLRSRQEEYELELVESRQKYFEMQEKYYQLKLDHEATVRENKQLRKEIRELREEIKKLREKLDN